MKNLRKLKVRWSKRERDLICDFPLGRLTKCDCNYLYSKVFTDEFIKEIQQRGYDITTLKFSIDVDIKSECYQTKFQTLFEEELDLVKLK